MKKIAKRFIFPTIISSSILLTACGGGGGGDDSTANTNDTSITQTTSQANAHYFVGTTQSSGSELWKTDGTENGTVMVKEINKTSHSYPSNFVQIGDVVYFIANNEYGKELWKREAGTVQMVKNIHPTGNSNPQSLIAHNSKLYFLASDDVSTNSLWESDGTEAGTIKISSLSSIYSLTSVSNTKLFFVTGRNSSTKLHIYDGVSVKEIVPTSAVPTNISMLTAVGEILYFSGYTSTERYELWKSDGTNAGTVLAKDLAPGSGYGLYSGYYSGIYSVNGKLVVVSSVGYPYNHIYTENTTGTDIVPFEVVYPDDTVATPVITYYGTQNVSQDSMDGDLYFSNYSDNRYTWRTDGTAAGTNLLTNLIRSSKAKVLKSENGTKFIYAQNSLQIINETSDGLISLDTGILSDWTVAGDSAYCVSENQLKVTDGTNAAVKIADLTTNPVLFGGSTELYMSYNGDDAFGKEPWVSDGTISGTMMLADINQNPTGHSYPSGEVVFNNMLYFIADDGVNGQSVWKTDGTEAGTIKLTSTAFGEVKDLTISGGNLYFIAEEEVYGREVWVSDGTDAGTKVLIDLSYGPDYSDPYSLVDVNGTLFFIVRNRYSNDYIWKTNGSLESTSLVSTIDPLTGLIPSGDKVYFVASPDGDDELWVSDGTFLGARIVKDINPSGDAISYNYFNAISMNNILYFTADDGANGRELWKTNGTEEGTQMVVNLNGPYDGLDRYDVNLVTSGDYLYFTDANGELWKTDGTEVNSIQLTDYNTTGGYISSRDDYAIFNNKVYFAASNDTDGLELWETDGTVAGTKMLKDINTSGSSNPSGFDVFNNTLFFYADNGTLGKELWKSDGTEEGTVLVKDIFVGDKSGAHSLYSNIEEYD